MTKRMLWEMMSNHHSRMSVEVEFLKRRVDQLERAKLREMGYEIDEAHMVVMVPDGDPQFHIVNLRANWPGGLKPLKTEDRTYPYYRPGGWQWKLIQNGVDITP